MNTTEAMAESIEAGGSAAERRQKIDELGRVGDSDATRVLLTHYSHSMWRETRIDIIRALSHCNNDRSLEFLVDVARDQSDLQLAGEAILSIGQTSSPMGGEVLLGFVESGNHPLTKEAVIGLSNMRLFPCEEAFTQLLKSKDTLGPTITQFLIIGLGCKARGGAWPLVEAFLDPDRFQSQIFNAALISAGKLGRSEALVRLQKVDTRYRFFANQLKIAAIEQIHYRLSSSFEDIYSLILHNSEPSAALNTLRQYPHDDAWEAFEILGEGASADLSATVRLALSDRSRAATDLAFINEQKGISPTLRAALYREYLFLSEKVALASFASSGHCLEICLSLYHPAIFEWLIDDGNASAATISGLNAMVAQCQMRPELSDRIGQALLSRMGSFSQPLRQRAIRALGQIRFDHPTVYTFLQQQLKSEDFSSVVSAYGMLASDEAQSTITKQIKQLPQNGNNIEKLRLLVSRLAAFNVNKPEVIVKYVNVPEIRDDILKILGRTPVDDPAIPLFIESHLISDNHKTRMLAIAAAKHNHNDAIVKLMFKQFDSAIKSLKFRALDTICHMQNGSAHLLLIEKLAETEVSVIEKTVRSLAAVPGFNYAPAVRNLRQLQKNRQDLGSNSEITSGIYNLIENLSLKSDAETARTESSSHPVDKSLAIAIPMFDKLSSASKAALRNAELTQSESVLFNDVVDKSTVLLEYVKCIDLQFQEKIGTKMFLGSDRLIDIMRTRILELGLDEENQNIIALLDSLQCTRQFPASDFPSHKLFSICQGFLTGKIAREQYKVLDGLRAWGLLLLLFGRAFTFRGKQLSPILKVLDSSNPLISSLAYELNQLQELRNLAAHRGTLVSKVQVDSIRVASVACLNRTLQVIG